MSEPVAVLGAGSWGTALAWLLGEKGTDTRLWCRDPERAAAIRRERRNAKYLPDLPLSPTVFPTADLKEALSGSRTVVLAVPTQAARETLRGVRKLLPRGCRIALAAKGLERSTGKRLSEVAREELGRTLAGGIAVLSGPNLAGEIVARIPTASVVASGNLDVAREIQEQLGTPAFRIYTNRDLTGVELGGALKNPIAIAAGISDGIGYGANTKASLLTRGLAEMTRIGVAAGARAETFSGLSGLGDLFATANSPLSRNYRLGLALAHGETLEQASESLHQVAEGVPTAEAACRLAERLRIEIPIIREVRDVLCHGKPLPEAVASLLSRPYKDEGIFHQ